jgi:CheY-like chemotaxis protein
MSFKAMSILVADDCAHMRAIVGAILRGIGVGRIKECADGADALDELRHWPYDMLITDIAMPTLDGVELTRLIRASPDSPNPFLPIIVMTAHSERRRIVAARDAGANEIIVKPISAYALISRFLSIIEKPRMFVRVDGFSGPDRRRRNDPNYKGALRRETDQSFVL